MLTKEQYQTLRRYRDTPYIQVSQSGLSSREQYLADQGYIEPVDFGADEIGGVLQIFTKAYRITQPGRAALAEYEQRRRERWFQVFLVVLGDALVLALARLICYLLF